jgi:hypothetical protein
VCAGRSAANDRQICLEIRFAQRVAAPIGHWLLSGEHVTPQDWSSF